MRSGPRTSADLRGPVITAAVVLLLSLTLVACRPWFVPGWAAPLPDPDQPVAVLQVYPDVEYYNPCGNSGWQHDGRTLYPLLPDEREQFDPTPYAYGPGTSLSVMALPAVAPPGPGDDTGTLTVYENGMAKFVSDSGGTTWFTSSPRSYDWIC